MTEEQKDENPIELTKSLVAGSTETGDLVLNLVGEWTLLELLGLKEFLNNRLQDITDLSLKRGTAALLDTKKE